MDTFLDSRTEDRNGSLSQTRIKRVSLLILLAYYRYLRRIGGKRGPSGFMQL